MTYLAHSAKGDIPPQTYCDHVENVTALVQSYLKELLPYAIKDKAALSSAVDRAAPMHDLGKLNTENQTVLHEENSKKALPVHHQDAGAAFFLQEAQWSPMSAALIQAHHTGYPDFPSEANRGKMCFRDAKAYPIVEKELDALVSIHASLKPMPVSVTEEKISGDFPVLLRMALSCLADADHTDTARHYGNDPAVERKLELRPAERLAQLDKYVAGLKGSGQRSQLRQQMYESCRNARIDAAISSCDSPVGSGKTTAVMAHLLKQAQNRDLRRIFVVLPFTNIIQQSVDVYRKALVLPGEKPEEVVAELHHRADFESEDLRYLTALWRAPIIVTTAVAFFETLASNTPSALRRLHELPGSAIFVDESHAALPAHLLPVAWHWMNVYADDWKCYWVLASGSLERFWNIPELTANHTRDVPEIVTEELRIRLSQYESTRVRYRWDLEPKGCLELAEWVMSFPGPRLLILNTVQSAAVVAQKIKERFGRDKVEHLSTALTAEDRENTLKRVKKRLSDASDADWILVATSCVEAGVDFSFRFGFREIGSLVSLLQASGRVNRSGNYSDSEMWSFRLKEERPLKANPGLECAARILYGYLKREKTPAPCMSTQSLQDEIRAYGLASKEDICEDEMTRCFRRVEEKFRVIDTDTEIVVVDPKLADAIRNGGLDWKRLQKCSVQINRYKLKQLQTPKINDEIYEWNLPYDDFIGYMAGILPLEASSGMAFMI